MSDLPSYIIDRVRAWLRPRVEEGVDCPCCGQFAKVYKRPLHSGMARVLIAMYNAPTDDDGYVYLPSLRGIELGGDTAKARYWGLIEEPPDVERPDGSKRVGQWRLTNLGKSFVRGTITIPKYARIYNGRCLDTQGDEVSIREALGKRFDYDELMS